MSGKQTGQEESLYLTGKLSAVSLSMTDASINLDNTAAMQSISLTQAKDAAKNPVENILTRSRISGNASMSVAGNLKLTENSHITLGMSGAAKTPGFTVNGNLTLGRGCSITLSGAKPQTLTVKGALTLESGSHIIMDQNFVTGKTYKLITFGSCNVDNIQDFYFIFGVDGSICDFTIQAKALTMKLTGTWEQTWTASEPVATSLASEETEEGTEEDQEEGDEAGDEENTPRAVARITEMVTVQAADASLPDYSGVADALVQANWGLVETSRAFVNTIANRSMAVQLGSGERAVWASAIGGSSRRSSAGGHAGADTSITGGALGMETQLGENSLLGMALGHSWTRVSAHGFGKIKQDTLHAGLYGQTNWGVLSADWSAAYGRSESKSMGSSWDQQSFQLDGRLSYNHALTDNVLLRGFAGAQYYSHNSDKVEGIDTGKVQNLRAEIGVGIVRATAKSSVYAELALHHDIVRDNPEVRVPDGRRYHGLNPGRTGINITVGGSYALSEQWSLNASYTAEIVENATSHSINAGATYKF
jgi:hypothetical protein